MTDLRALLPTLAHEDAQRLADALGRELARMHDAGFDHPDLFAKHILAAPASLAAGPAYRFCILDWQRARRRRSVPWHIRCRDLAVLDATLHESLGGNRLRLRCLRAYGRAVVARRVVPPFARLARQIREAAQTLRRNRNIREVGQPAIPAHDQQFLSLCDGRLFVVRSFQEELVRRAASCLSDASDLESATREIEAVADAMGLRTKRIGSESVSRGEMPPAAHTLFRLQRFGVAAPRLLAVAPKFVLVQSVPATPLAEAFAKANLGRRARMLRQAGWIVRQIHEAGYHLPAGVSWEQQLGVDAHTENVVVVRVESLARSRAPWEDLGPMEFNRLKMRLSRAEQLRFLQGYLRQKHAGATRDPAFGAARALPYASRPGQERQAVS